MIRDPIPVHERRMKRTSWMIPMVLTLAWFPLIPIHKVPIPGQKMALIIRPISAYCNYFYYLKKKENLEWLFIKF